MGLSSLHKLIYLVYLSVRVVFYVELVNKYLILSDNLNFKLAIYQKLANFQIDDVGFFAGSLEGFRSFGGSSLFQRVTQVTYET